MFIGYDEVAKLLQLDEREKELDTLFITSSNEYVAGYLDREFDDVPAIVIDCVIRLFLFKKIEHSQNILGVFDIENSVYEEVKSCLDFFRKKSL